MRGEPGAGAGEGLALRRRGYDRGGQSVDGELLDLDLVDTIDRLLTTHQVPPEALILEITEVHVRQGLVAVSQDGVRSGGWACGSRSTITAPAGHLSVDELKLDRIFVSRLAEDPRSIAIVRSTVALAHSLGADMVAEG